MPRQRVYGKRAAPKFSNYTHLPSPTRPASKPTSTITISKTTDVVEIVSSVDIDDIAVGTEHLNVSERPGKDQKRASLSGPRNILGAIDTNVVGAKPRRRQNSGTGRRVQSAVREVTARVKESLSKEGVEDTVAVPSTGRTGGEERQPSAISIESNADVLVERGDEDARPGLGVKRVARQKPHVPASSVPLEQTAESVSPGCAPSGRKRLPTRSAKKTVEEERNEIVIDHVQPLLRLCSDSSKRFGPTSFESYAASREKEFKITKIAEASYGEVYRLSLKKPRSGFSSSDEWVIKFIPLQAPPALFKHIQDLRARRKARETSASMSAVADVTSEVKVLDRMTNVPGFTNFRDIEVLRGRPAKAFVTAWQDFNTAQRAAGRSESVLADPGLESSYDDDQLWAAIEMQDAGEDLERFKVENVFQSWDVFWGVALALAKAEKYARFEHRDLHLGNICVRGTKNSGRVSEMSSPANRNLNFTPIETTIIDYTLSRADLEETVQSEDGGSRARVAYFDLDKDRALFEGDGEIEYQYEIYRHMESAMHFNDPLRTLDDRKKENREAARKNRSAAHRSGKTWEGFHPQTNLVWLHFVLHKLREQYDAPSEPRKESEDPVVRKAWGLEQALRRMSEKLSPESLHKCGMDSAGQLAELALREQWLTWEDILGSEPQNAENPGDACG
ncbi:hypothetical protein B0A49_06647 [Cryomyces minteri]|uniref:non-specific serine/threonine protein kinase n=1 Tax=Cryomyces minteri TaxID=331657 RepID=A0A4U0X5X9_9PEZI|nr:hypothetical protein B0A49_06647 [Cryomyces minteri]